jgi:hypothetical protein
MAESLQQVHQPPPGAGGFDRHRGFGWELREELLHALDVLGESMPREFAVLAQDRNLRRVFCARSTPT